MTDTTCPNQISLVFLDLSMELTLFMDDPNRLLHQGTFKELYHYHLDHPIYRLRDRCNPDHYLPYKLGPSARSIHASLKYYIRKLYRFTEQYKFTQKQPGTVFKISNN